MKKKCSKCENVKSLNEFNTRPDRKAGYRGECKQCQYDAQRKRYNKHTNKHQAKNIANHAFKKGELQKPLCCEKCFEAKPLDRHHPDYNKPLEVKWLCRKCHTATHSQQGSYSKTG